MKTNFKVGDKVRVVKKVFDIPVGTVLEVDVVYPEEEGDWSFASKGGITPGVDTNFAYKTDQNDCFEPVISEEMDVAPDEVRVSDKRQFSTGAMRDNDDTKEDYIETIPWRSMKRYAQYMTGKKKTYGEGNFKKGIPIESYEQSLVRHLQKYLENKYEDGTTEVSEDHLSAMVFNVFGIMYEEGRDAKAETSSDRLE